MDPDLKQYLRTNERLAIIIAAEMCEHPGEWRELCVAIRLDDGTELGDHFYLPNNEWATHDEVGERLQAFKGAIGANLKAARHCAEWVGRRIIVTLDEKWNPENYTSILAHLPSNRPATRPAGQ